MPASSRHILAVSAVSHPGGAETTLLRLLRGLRRRGWRVTLTTPGEGPLRAAALQEGWGWRRLPVGSLRRGGGARAVISWPRAVALARDADVLYLNGGVAGRLLPAVSLLPRAERAAARKPPPAPVPLPLRRRRAALVLHVHDLVERVPPFWRHADLILDDSAAVAARLGDLPSKVVYCPVDLDPPAAAPPWPAGGGPVIGFVGRLEPRKAPHDLVAAAPAIRTSLPDARIVLIGDEPYGLSPAYAREVAGAEGIEAVGWRADAPGLMRSLDVLVLPTREEPFGVVLAEAMAVGTPVVATCVGGIPEVVEDGVSGRLVAPGDVAGLAAAVLEVLRRREEMGRAARRRAQRFGTEAYVRRVAGLLEELCA